MDSGTDSQHTAGGGRPLSALRVGELLVELGVVPPPRLAQALEDQKRTGLVLGEQLELSRDASRSDVQLVVRIQEQMRGPDPRSGPFFAALVRNHPIWYHPLLRRARARRLRIAEVKAYLVQAHHLLGEVPGILAAALVVSDDEHTSTAIVDVLYDCVGHGDAMWSFARRFRAIVRALGMTDEELEATPPSHATLDLVRVYKALPDELGCVPTLGALCYGTEDVETAPKPLILEGLDNGPDVPPEGLEGLGLHLPRPRGENVLAREVDRRVQTVECFLEVAEAIRSVLDARERFLDALERQTARSGVPGPC